eukprot:TRINITY_DN12451_c0_g1_i13.p1 TRINITY_DN12451_c0_g1~~TRINITY_DN12451_c0_g1_i13.p1  ORF type:complete len:171 (+),score=39.09 TRINITY_DN12451_c0_g1_i13:2908-3420(+)
MTSAFVANAITNVEIDHIETTGLLDDHSSAFPITFSEDVKAAMLAAVMMEADSNSLDLLAPSAPTLHAALLAAAAALDLTLSEPAWRGNGSRKLYFALLEAKIRQHEQLTLQLVASATFEQHCVAPEAIHDMNHPELNARGLFLNELRWQLIEEDDEESCCSDRFEQRSG